MCVCVCGGGGGGGGGGGLDRQEEGDTGRGRSVETDSGKIAKTDFSIVLSSTYFMIRILQPVMTNMMN